MIGTILVILYRRPGYTAKVLEALAAQPEIGQFHVHFQIDGCVKDVINQAVDFNATTKSININGQNARCTLNVYTGLCVAFSMSDFVIVVEDDTVPAHDFLKYMLWARPFIDDDCRTISAYHKYENCPPRDYHVVRFMPRWCAWGWATTRKHWEVAKQVWDWDTRVSWYLMIAINYFWQRKTIMPMLSRCRNIGRLDGTYTVNPEQHDRDVMVHAWADSVDTEDKPFEFVPGLREGEETMWDQSRDILYRDLK